MKRNQLKIDSFFTRAAKLSDKNENDLVNKDIVSIFFRLKKKTKTILKEKFWKNFEKIKKREEF